MFNTIKIGSRFRQEKIVLIVTKVISENFYELQEKTTKEKYILSKRELELDYKSLDDFIPREEQEHYKKWAKEILNSPQMKEILKKHKAEKKEPENT